MSFVFDLDKQVLNFNGKRYARANLESFREDLLAKYNNENNFHLFELYDFLKSWFDDKDYLEVMTSGSTGPPKKFLAKKSHMLQSAKNTCETLKLTAHQSALLCMPLQFIGAKMMVVRALFANLNLYHVKPSLRPLQHLDFSPNFVAMTPQQATVSMQNAADKKILQNVEHLLLGGMAVNQSLENAFKHFEHNVWLGYGMTETLSHIALRKLNGKDASSFFAPLKGISLSLSHDETLMINAPLICEGELKTSDRAEIFSDGTFQILGRVDNVVNSGGIKIQLEQVEENLAPHFLIPFQLTAMPHDELGEQLVLLTDKACPNWKEHCQGLHKYHIPKLHIVVKKLPLTANGKPHRDAAKMLAREYLLSKA